MYIAVLVATAGYNSTLVSLGVNRSHLDMTSCSLGVSLNAFANGLWSILSCVTFATGENNHMYCLSLMLTEDTLSF